MAYAALSSLLQTLNQIPQPAEQSFASLQEKVSSLMLILQNSSQDNDVPVDDHLEGRIRDASYQVEYIIESYLSATQALISQSEVSSLMEHMYIDFQGLQERIDEFESLVGTRPGTNVSSSIFDQSESSKSNMVGRHDDLMKIVDQLTGYPHSLAIISIVGTGGLGKTTLARNVYTTRLIEHHFDICAWIVISQEYDVGKLLTSLLNSTNPRSGQLHGSMSIEDLSMELHRSLKFKRYLIIMDDVWNTKFWDHVKRFFPDDHNGSRIILTSRSSQVASYFGTDIYQLSFLDEDTSWHLLCQEVFGKESCPLELEETGKMIAKKCNGLPLSIVLIGKILSKGIRTREYWEYVAKNVTNIIIATENGQYFQILSSSYTYLPHHLKRCFLYMGAFPQDHEFYVSNLIKIWIAEGFVNPPSHTSLEEAAKGYLDDLIGSNLISICRKNHNGGIKSCILTHELRGLCVKIAHDEKFFQIIHPDTQVSAEGKNNQLRLSICSDTLAHLVDLHEASVHTLLYFCTSFPISRFLSITLGFTMLRVLDALTIRFNEFPVDIVELVYLRYLALLYEGNTNIPESISKLRSLQTLIVCRGDTLTLVGNLTSVYLPSSIWGMPQLRHLLLEKSFILPPKMKMVGKHSVVILENLQTLSGMLDFKFSREVLEVMPNLKKLGISYLDDAETNWSSYEFHNIEHLQKLESLKCHFIVESSEALPVNLAFPRHLRKLSLSGGRFPWEKMSIVGSLPVLEVLKLKDHAFDSSVWETVEEQFMSLKFLLIEDSNLEHWWTEDTHFPRLEHLTLRYCPKLMEIPLGIGDTPTLQMLEVYGCSSSAGESARRIQEEQLDMGNDDLMVRVNGSLVY